MWINNNKLIFSVRFRHRRWQPPRTQEHERVATRRTRREVQSVSPLSRSEPAPPGPLGNPSGCIHTVHSSLLLMTSRRAFGCVLCSTPLIDWPKPRRACSAWRPTSCAWRPTSSATRISSPRLTKGTVRIIPPVGFHLTSRRPIPRSLQRARTPVCPPAAITPYLWATR